MGKNYAGVFVTEKFSKKKVSQQGVVGAGAFIGITPKGEKDSPILVTSYEEFTEKTGGRIKDNPLAYSVMAFFKEEGGRAYIINPKMDDSTINKKDKDQLSQGAVFTARSINKTTTAGVINLTKAKVLYNNTLGADDYIDYPMNNKVVTGANISSIDLASFRVKLNGIVIGMSDESGVINPVANYIDIVNNETIRIKSTTSGIDLALGDSVDMDANIISIELETVVGASPTIEYNLEIEYVLTVADLKYKTMSSTVLGSAVPEIVLTILPADLVGNTALTIDDIQLDTLDLIVGADHYFYNPVTKAISSSTGAFTANVTAMALVGGVLTLTMDADSSAVAVGATAKFKVDISKQESFYTDHSTAYSEAGNNFYLLESRYEANAYNDYFVQMSASEDYLDSNYKTVFIDADVYENQYSDTGELVSPILAKDIMKMSFNPDSDDYFFTMFNDKILGSETLTIDKNSMDNEIPLSLQSKPNGDTVNGYHYGNTTVVPNLSVYPVNTNVLNTSLREVIKGSVILRKGVFAGGIAGVIEKTYQDNGIGGFIDITDPSTGLQTVSINYETGIITGMDVDFGTNNSGNDGFIDVACAFMPVIQEQDYTLDFGVGGTSIQSALLSSAVVTDLTLESQGRGIFALSKIQGEYIAWGIPHLTTSYGTAVSCMEFCDKQDVKRFNYVWNLDDSLTESQVGQLLRTTYKYRSKNSFVTYPFLEVEDIESTVIRSGSRKTVNIPYVGTLIGKIANRIGTSQPYESIAGKENGRIKWGVGPTRKLSPALTEELTDLVIPAIDSYDTGFVFWGDGSLADRNYDFETVSDTLVFGMVQYDVQSLLWSYEFKNVDDYLIKKVQSAVTRYLLAKTRLGWFGTNVPNKAFSVDISKNNQSTKEARQIFIDLEIALPYSLKQVHISLARKHS